MAVAPEVIANTSGTAEDRLANTLQRLIAKTQREQQEQQPDMADIVFSFTSGDTATALTTAVPALGARTDFPCRLVGAYVFESSLPTVTSSVSVAFYFRVPPTASWTPISGTALGFSSNTRVDLDDTTGWQRFFDPGTEYAATLVSVASARSITAALKVRKLGANVSNAVGVFGVSGASIVDQIGNPVGSRRN